jgi:hypothetical protein
VQNHTLPVIIEETSLDFVFIGSHEGEQQLLARSRNLDLLVLGVARVPIHLAVTQNTALHQAILHDSKSITGLYDNDPQATLYSITVTINLTGNPSTRDEPFTFAWLGRSPEADLEPIRDYFRNCVVPLHQAISENDPQAQVQWQLAPLLFLCAKWTKTQREIGNSQKYKERSFWREPSLWVFVMSILIILLSIVRPYLKNQ